ncbi:MAG: aspartate aminotransferase family protein [Gammaproteobacteria bacterium]
MSRLLHRHTQLQPPTAVEGDGCYLIDADGKRYLDASGGAAVSCLGHSHRAVVDATKRQIDTLAYAHSSFFTTEAAEALADLLIDDARDALGAAAGPNLSHVYLVSGGSEAVEAALKLARQYHVERGEPQRRHLVARLQSYHGNTLGALAAGGNVLRREPFEPLLAPTHHISPCYAYRHRRADESEAAYGLRAADELEAKILELGGDTVMAFICEPVVGATLGAVPAVEGYLNRIREICDRYGVLLIFDEVMCGMGRTGTVFSCEHDGVSPDLMTVAKGLGAGYQPIGAMLLSEAIYDTIERGSGFFQHGQTCPAHATAAASALAVQRAVHDENLLARVPEMGAALDGALQERLGNHPNVGDIRGRGLLVGLELVEDRTSKSPFDPAHGLHKRIKREAMSRGLLCYPMGGTLDGTRGDHVLLAPPFIIEQEQVETIASKLGDAVDAAIASLNV